MTQDQLTKLKARLYSDAALNVQDKASIATALGTPRITYNEYFATTKSLLRDLDTTIALALFNAVQNAAAAGDPLNKLILGFLNDGTGIDMSLPKSQQLLNGLLQAGELTQQQVDAILALNQVKIFPDGGFDGITSNDILLAQNSNAADVLAVNLGSQVQQWQITNKVTIDQKATTAQQRLTDYQNAIFSGQTVTAPTLDSILA